MTLILMEVLGIDIGGSMINTAVVNLNCGSIISDRFDIQTPHPAHANALLDIIQKLLQHYDWSGPVGVGFPGVVLKNEIRTAPNLDSSLVGINLEKILLDRGVFEATGINEADAAGIAEVRFGAARNIQGTVLMVTIGTGVGTALFYKGSLHPNIELGHAEFRGKEAEIFLSERARANKKVSWKAWANDMNGYLNYLVDMLSVEAVILGGDVVNHREKFQDYLSLPCPLKLAHFGEEAGIIGAALAIDC